MRQVSPKLSGSRPELTVVFWRRVSRFDRPHDPDPQRDRSAVGYASLRSAVSVVDDRGRPTGLDPVDRNKAIFVVERMTCAYAGHADIGGTDTAEWLQTRLGSCFSRGLDLAAAIEEVRIMATQYLASIDADPRNRAVADRWQHLVSGAAPRVGG
jgi:hypothetical protein